ncbi:MAG: RHS repeat-associated core domain-containing protein, partial [Actinomycetota bacterium]
QVSVGGGITVAGVEWMGARVYDPVARGFLSVDPLPAVTGAAWGGNPYSYAGNDPLHAVDPLGLAPITDEELRGYADSLQGPLAQAAGAVGHWWNENWEYVAGGAMVVAGGVMMATGVGGPVGMMLIGAGANTIIQKATTGDVNWGEVAISGAFSFGGAGLVGGLATQVGGNAVEGAVENLAVYAVSGQPLTIDGFLTTAGTGAVVSAATFGAMSKIDIPTPKLADLPALPPNLEATFAGGRYNTSVLAQSTVLYRAGDAQGSPLGQFFSAAPPVGIVQTRIDKAIPLAWPNGQLAPINTGYAVEFPAGTTINTGVVANQGGIYMGGTEQIVIQRPWELPGVEVVDQWTLN